MRRHKPTLWLSFGLVSLTLAITLTGYVLGFVPDGYKAELESRAKVAESLAIQLAGAVNRNELRTVKETLAQVVTRNNDVYSGALRKADGSLLLFEGDHDAHWVSTPDGKSTPTHVSVPLIGAAGIQGTIELVFGPPSVGKRFFGIPATLILFLGFLVSFGFIGYFFILRRTLKQLDPGRVIPERVQKAFDTLSEGVIILDEKERILLVNTAFSSVYGVDLKEVIGSKINHMPWRMVDGRAQAGGYPWHTALREGTEMREDALSLRSADGTIHNFNVNATTVNNDRGKSIGAIVTLRDMTGYNRSKEELDKTVEELKAMQKEASRQKRELNYLATHDSLTGCLNRRAFFGRFQLDAEETPDLGTGISVMMVSADQYDQVAREKGPVESDIFVVGIANVLRSICGEKIYIARLMDGKFCLALMGHHVAGAEALAKRLQGEIGEASSKLLSAGMKATLSIGVASRKTGAHSVHALIAQADAALDRARISCSGAIEFWDDTPTEPANRPSQSQITQSRFDLETNPAKANTANSDHLASQTTKFAKSELILADRKEQFFNKADQSIALARQNMKSIAILNMSISTWSYLEEALGEQFCAKLLKRVEHVTKQTLRETDGVLSIGPQGELLIELSTLESADDVEWTISRLQEVLQEPLDIDGQRIDLSIQLGVALFPDAGSDSKTLAQNAKVALRRTKEESPLEGYLHYSPQMSQDSSARLKIESGIREALNDDAFQLNFQPIIEAQTGKLSGAEALLRCNNPALSEFNMDQIVDVAEKSSLIGSIDKWVIRTALRHMQEWIDKGIHLPKISINISAKQLTNIEFMDAVFDTISTLKFSPSRVQIEVTETARMADVQIAAPQLKRLQQLGVSIALDDFGTGQSSLTYLQRLHPDVIKIDRSFVTGVNTNHANATLVSSMTVMAHCLGLQVVVEGVEDSEQMDFLRATSCDHIQGYFISRPLPADQFSEWVHLFSRKLAEESHNVTTSPGLELSKDVGLSTKAA